MVVVDHFIPKEPQWVFTTDNEVEWGVDHYSIKAAVLIEEHSKGTSAEPIEVVRALFGVMCKRQTTEASELSQSELKPTESELSALSETDINRFSQQLLAHDPSLTSTSGEDCKRHESESDAAFLVRLLEVKNRRDAKSMGDMIANLSGLAHSKSRDIRSVTDELLKQAEGIESQYGFSSSPFRTVPRKLELPPLPPNPAHETNTRLGDVSERLEILVGFGENALKIMQSIQAAAAGAIEDFSIEGEKNSLTSRRALRVALAAVVIAIGQVIYTEFWRVPQDTASMNAAIEEIQAEIDELQAALVANLENSRSADQTAIHFLAEAIVNTGDAEAGALQRIEQLLHAQTKNDAALVAAIAALSDTLSGPRERKPAPDPDSTQ